MVTYMTNKIYLGKTLGSFLIVLLLMPIGHAIMILMDVQRHRQKLNPSALPATPGKSLFCSAYFNQSTYHV